MICMFPEIFYGKLCTLSQTAVVPSFDLICIALYALAADMVRNDKVASIWQERQAADICQLNVVSGLLTLVRPDHHVMKS